MHIGNSLRACAWQAHQGYCLIGRSFLMKRMHVHVAVDDLDRSIGFYSACSQRSLSSSKRTTQSGCLMIRA
jgi:hypothetical protein